MPSAATPHDTQLQIATLEANSSELRTLLLETSLLLSSFRWKLQRAGYPFCEPPNVDRTLARIDKACFPEEHEKPRGKRGNKAAQHPAP